MNKKLFWIRNITFFIGIVLYIISFSGTQSVTFGPQLNILYGFLTFFLLVELLVLGFSKHDINHDLKYNSIFIVINLLFIFIYLRTMFDNSITTVYIGNHFSDQNMAEFKYNFLNSNFIYFIFLNLGLILYPFTYLKSSNKQEKVK